MTPEQIDEFLTLLRELVVATEKLNSNVYDAQYMLDDISMTLKRHYAYSVSKDLQDLKSTPPEAKH